MEARRREAAVQPETWLVLRFTHTVVLDNLQAMATPAGLAVAVLAIASWILRFVAAILTSTFAIFSFTIRKQLSKHSTFRVRQEI